MRMFSLNRLGFREAVLQKSGSIIFNVIGKFLKNEIEILTFSFRFMNQFILILFFHIFNGTLQKNVRMEV